MQSKPIRNSLMIAGDCCFMLLLKVKQKHRDGCAGLNLAPSRVMDESFHVPAGTDTGIDVCLMG